MLQQAIVRCEQIDARDSQSGLWLNPAGYRTYYERSACLQRTAIEFRERALCDQVRRRYALFSSGWGYSRDNCRELVDAEIAEDRRELELIRQNYLAGPVNLMQVTVERNGNGRDYDFIPRFADGLAGGYELNYFIVDESRVRRLILSHGNYLTGSDNNLRIFLERQELLTAIPDLKFEVDYELEVQCTYSIGTGGPGGWYRQELIDDVFPAQERTKTYATAISF